MPELNRLADCGRSELLLCHINTVTLRLYEPPVLDAALLKSLANALNTVGPGTTSALDIFYQSNAALKGWFDTWLSIPVATYYSIPQPTFALVVYAITMMGRWAKYGAPQTSVGAAAAAAKLQKQQRQQQQQQQQERRERHPSGSSASFSTSAVNLGSCIVDPSSHNPNVALAAADAAMNPTTPSGLSSSTTAVSSVASSASTPAPPGAAAANFVLKADVDKDLPGAITALKARLATQPDLMLDIAEILSAVAQRAEEANAAMVEAAVEPGAWDNNIWGLGITKIKITIAKLQRFAELISAGPPRTEGTETATTDGGESDDEGMDDADEYDDDENDVATSSNSNHNASYNSGHHVHVDAHMGGVAVADGYGSNPDVWPPQAATAYPENWICNTPWANDIFDGIDASVWLDRTTDWEALVLSSLGNGGTMGL
jgi:hypothetical protein